MAKYNYHKERCNSRVRATVKQGNTVISLMGTHAFEWSIVIESNNKITITTFPNRKGAINEFKRYR